MSTLPTAGAGAGLGNAPRLSARRAQTQERLMGAAVAVFAERGVNGASVEEICEAAGFTRGAFYSNFADKSELILAMIRASVENQYAAAEASVAAIKESPARSAEDMIGVALDALLRSGRTDDDGLLADRELLLQAARDPEVRGPYLAYMSGCRERIATLITDALDHLGLELSIPFDHAMTLLIATNEHQQLTATLEQQPADGAVMRSLLMAITRPSAGADR